MSHMGAKNRKATNERDKQRLMDVDNGLVVTGREGGNKKLNVRKIRCIYYEKVINKLAFKKKEERSLDRVRRVRLVPR